MRLWLTTCLAALALASLSLVGSWAPSIDGATAGAAVARPARPVVRYLTHGSWDRRAVALTFDDGPHPESTPKLLAILRQQNVKATFFVVGKMAKQYPGLLDDIAAGGHVIGNHTYNHVDLTRLSERRASEEWQSCNRVVESIIGRPMSFCRPPGGNYNGTVISSAVESGLTTVLWTAEAHDYARPAEWTIARRVLDETGNGGIILLHDGPPETMAALPYIIQRLKQRGYRFETVGEMAAERFGRS